MTIIMPQVLSVRICGRKQKKTDKTDTPKGKPCGNLHTRLLIVPKTGFEPARRFQRYHLKVVRLPISPPGQVLVQN